MVELFQTIRVRVLKIQEGFRLNYRFSVIVMRPVEQVTTGVRGTTLNIPGWAEGGGNNEASGDEDLSLIEAMM